MSKPKENYTVLLAEDELFLSRTFENRLTLEGFTVLLAHDGEDAIQMILKEKPDLILLDLIMPKKNGFEVLEIIKKDELVQHIPVIITSNLGQDSDIEKAMKLGAVDYIIKSNISLKDLAMKVKEHLPLK
ncbi:MAG: Response regulator receiver domain protein [Parcubacteria group bacterium GW2011_GWA2_43_11]|nr:MAG: Response regulator receiver domain protein [Parcubacteria group bacterium GW2011_GWC2_42_11]KKS84268.1 MAG: Response regulator receiver domain protein [Parcubacteria group bacterium GW2011_GWA2_43_11]